MLPRKYSLLLTTSLLLTLPACFHIPQMKMQHMAQIHETYQPIGNMQINEFEDRRPIDEKRSKQIAGNYLTPQIWSGDTSPGMMIFLQNAMEEEAKRSNISIVTSSNEFKLNGYVTSIKVDRTSTVLNYLTLGWIEFPKIQAYVQLHANLTKNRVVVCQSDINHFVSMRYWQLLEPSAWGFHPIRGVSRKTQKVLDQAITEAIKNLFDDIENKVKGLTYQ